MSKLITTVRVPGVCCATSFNRFESLAGACAVAVERMIEDYKLDRERSYIVEDNNGEIISTYSRQTHGLDSNGKLFVYDTAPLPYL